MDRVRRRQAGGPAAGRTGGRHLFATAANAAATALGVATVAGFGAAAWWPFELFSHFRLQYVAAALLLVVVFAARSQPRWAAFASVLVLVNGLGSYQSLRAASKPDAGERPADTIRVLALNVFDLSDQYERVAGYVRRERADVVVLAELTRAWMPSVRQLAAEYPYHWINERDPLSGMAMFSRRSPVASGSITLAGSQTPAHLVTLATDQGPLSILATQAQWPVSAALARARNRQLDALAAEARRRGNEALAVIGDLNVSPFSPYYERLLASGGLRRCGGGGRWTPTWPTLFPPLYIQLDHCLTTARVRSWDFTRGEYVGSDHLPILVTLAPM